MPQFPVIRFSQYESSDSDDDLLLFAAPAKAIAAWAGIPRKGWHVRMLYQRWITPGREKELKDFWQRASTPEAGDGKRFILGPTALTIAIHGPAVIQGDSIVLDYQPPIDTSKPLPDNLSSIAQTSIALLRQRLTAVQQISLDEFTANPTQELPDTDHDYVLESAMQIVQMRDQPLWFINKHSLGDEEVREIITALEAISRPAVVVDGQHRLFGAADANAAIWLPVVAIPNCPWAEQIYQFVVINEKAKPIEASLLTDIFGSSLTRQEQRSLRAKLERSKVDVEQRIAAVIASREEDSPFYGMVRFQLQGQAPLGTTPYVPESAIRFLIEGGRGGRGWRSDDEFFDIYVSPTLPGRPDWESWTTGRWREYWFAFWRTVRDYYNDQAKKVKGDPNFQLWDSNSQSNLTKSVTLRLFQGLFMKVAIERVQLIEKTREVLTKALGPDIADREVKKQTAEVALPASIQDFERSVRDWFLDKGIPVRFFLKQWKSSLDDAQGQAALQDEMEKAFRYMQEGRRYHTRNTDVFAVSDESDE